MNLPKIIFLCGSCLLLNLTISQAQDAVIEQGEGSSSVPAASTALTPLAQDAREFLEIWQRTPRFINNDEDDEDPLSIYEGYINQIIEVDNFQNFSPSDPFDPPHNISQNFFTEENRKAREDAFDILLEAWQELVDDQNAFATYFLGYLLAEQTDPEGYSHHYQRLINNFLDNSSQRLYERATNFLLENAQWAKKDIDRNELLIRSKIIKTPEEALYRYIKTHAVKGKTSWGDIQKLENILIYSPQYSKNYLKGYHTLAEKLKSALILRKERESSFRTVEFWLANLLGSASVLITQGIINVVNDNQNKALFYTMGGIQMGSAVLGILATTTAYPYIINKFYQYQDWGFKGKLLPSSYSDDEISIQSHLVALLSIVLNNKYNIDELTKKSYIAKARKFILNQYEGESTALSGPLNVNNKSFLKLQP